MLDDQSEEYLQEYLCLMLLFCSQKEIFSQIPKAYRKELKAKIDQVAALLAEKKLRRETPAE